MLEVQEPIQNDTRSHAQSEAKLRTMREEVRQLKWLVEQAGNARLRLESRNGVPGKRKMSQRLLFAE